MSGSLRATRAAAHALALSLAWALAGASACVPGGESDSPPAADTLPAEADGLLRLDAEEVTRAGIVTVTASESRFERTARGFGRVLDPLLIVDAVAVVEAARAADEGAAAERVRMENLARDEQNASLRDLATARTIAARTRADLAMARARLVAQIGPQLARDPELVSLADRLADGRASLIRIDVSGSERPPAPERGVTLTTYPPSAAGLEFRFAGPAAAVDAALPGYALLFLATANAPPAGTTVVADCRTADPPEVGVELPVAALVYHAGQSFVFVDRGANAFERRAVETIARDDGSLFVSKGLAPGERVVAAGAEQLLSADLLGESAGAAEE